MVDMIALRPPADADNYRVKAGRFGDRFYTDPLPADDTWEATGDDDIYPAISTVKKAVGQDWSRAMVKRLSRAPSQLVEIGGLDSEFERKARLNIVDESGLNGAGERGTVVHAHAEAKLMNRMAIYQMNDVVKPYIRTLDAFFAAFNPTLVAAEFVAIHRTLNAEGVRRGNEYLGFGGTGDAVVEIDGLLYLVDWKTRPEDGNHNAYPEEGGQVAGYGRADYWIVGCDESPNGAKRIEVPDLAGGLIVSIKPDSYECFPIDLDEGFAYWTDLHAFWQARRSERKMIGRKWAPRAEPTSELVVETTTITETTVEVTMTVDDPPTVTSNKARFVALTQAEKMKARKLFKSRKLNPNSDAQVGEVSRLIGEMEQRPTLREMQEAKAADFAKPLTPEATAALAAIAEPPINDPLDAEGGAATDELVGESRLLFDMVIGDGGKAWTGFRVKEANEAEVPFQVSKLRSMKRAHLYLALTRWAGLRLATLEADEAEGNVEFSSILFTIDCVEDAAMTLGHRLGGLTAEEAEKFAALVNEVVQSETGDNPVTETETQPASEPASEPTK